MTIQIVILCEPPSGRKLPFAAGMERYRRLSEELGQSAGGPVTLMEGGLRNAPENGYILFAGRGDLSGTLNACSPDQAARLPSRMVLLDVDWRQALEDLEKYRLAGAVDSLRLSEWLARPSSCKGPFGLRYLAKLLGVSCAPLPWFRSKHYCRLESNRHRGMPHLLVDYLLAYERHQKPLKELSSLALERFIKEFEAGDTNRLRAERTQTFLVNTEHAVASLKAAREHAGISLAQIGESEGFEPEELRQLEQGHFNKATLGMFRCYISALGSMSESKALGGKTNVWEEPFLPTSIGDLPLGYIPRINRREPEGELDNPSCPREDYARI